MIKSFAYKILSAARINTPAPDLFYICNFLKINVILIDFKTTFPSFNNYQSYTLFENNARVIYIDENLNPIQQRILLAHCLGHHFLGHTEKGLTFIDSLNNDYLPKNFTQFEINANIFAQHLLTVILPDFNQRYIVERETPRREAALPIEIYCSIIIPFLKFHVKKVP